MRRAAQVTKTEARTLFARAEALIKDAKSLSAAVNARIASNRSAVAHADRRRRTVDRRHRAVPDRRVDMRPWTATGR